MIVNKINSIFDFIPEMNLTEEYFYEHRGQYPVFSGQTENEGIVALIDGYNREIDCATVTTYGNNAGKLYFRNGKYTVGRNCMGIVPKEQYKDEINMKWFSFKFQNLIYRLRIGDPQGQRSLNRMLIEDIQITIPDTDVQNRQLKLYEKADLLKTKINKIYYELKLIRESQFNKFKPIHQGKIGKIFTIDGGNNGLTEDAIYLNQPYDKDESLPILSSATIQTNLLGIINKNAKLNGNDLKVFSAPAILVARNGFAGTMTYISEGQFTTNDHAYVMIPNDEWKDKVNPRWFAYQYQELFVNLVTSKSDNATFNKTYAENQLVILPDIDFQNKIVSKLYGVDSVMKELNKTYAELSDLIEHELI